MLFMSMYLTILKAISGKKYVRFTYDGISRKVAIHSIGFNKEGQIAFRGFQSYNVNTELKKGFKLFMLNKVSSLELLDSESFTKQQGFRKKDGYFQVIIATV